MLSPVLLESGCWKHAPLYATYVCVLIGHFGTFITNKRPDQEYAD